MVIGVSRFEAKEGAPPPLPQAAFDAKALASQLVVRGVKPENLLILADEQATADKVRIALGDFVAKAKPEDLLLVYWSTQGLRDPTSPDKVYLGTADTQMLHLADTAIGDFGAAIIAGTLCPEPALPVVFRCGPSAWPGMGLSGQVYRFDSLVESV